MPQTLPHADEARSANPLPMPEADIYEAVSEFVLSYALPGLEPPAVMQERQNAPLLLLLPYPDDCVVMSIIEAVQHGSTIESFTEDYSGPEQPGELCLKGLFKVGVRVDFYGSDDSARQRAQRLAVLARSGAGQQFFKEHGMSSLYAGDVLEKNLTDKEVEYARCYSVTLHLSAWAGVNIEFDYFDKASISRLQNVDASHPLTKE